MAGRYGAPSPHPGFQGREEGEEDCGHAGRHGGGYGYDGGLISLSVRAMGKASGMKCGQWVWDTFVRPFVESGNRCRVWVMMAGEFGTGAGTPARWLDVFGSSQV